VDSISAGLTTVVVVVVVVAPVAVAELLTLFAVIDALFVAVMVPFRFVRSPVRLTFRFPLPAALLLLPAWVVPFELS
jgi:hypothetical protein